MVGMFRHFTLHSMARTISTTGLGVQSEVKSTVVCVCACIVSVRGLFSPLNIPPRSPGIMIYPNMHCQFLFA